MADRVVLHVGMMKSGTTHLQALLFANRDALADQGVLVPGDTWEDQHVAVRDALFGRGTRARPRWAQLVRDVRAHPGPALVSMEYLGPARRKVAARIVDSFGSTPVEVIVTARDLNRTIPSMWQETVKSGRVWDWDEYVEDVRATRPGRGPGVKHDTSPGGTFWRQQNLARMCRIWSSFVGPERCTLVTVPPPGAPSDRLGRRFAEAAHVSLSTPVTRSGGNASLGLASTLALRRLNALLDERGLRFPAGRKLRRTRLAKQILAPRRGHEPALGLEVADWVVRQTADTRSALERVGVAVVGDLADLEPVVVPGVHPSQVPESEIAQAAVFGLAGLMEHQIRPSQEAVS
jgi:hypothetical protein